LKKRLDLGAIDAAIKVHQAFVFIKPHAVTDKTKEVVAKGLRDAGCVIVSEGSIAAETIDEKMLIDNHYGAIANRAVKQDPKDMLVPEKAQEGFKELFGLSWKDALESGKVYNAMDAAKKLGITGNEIGDKYDTLEKGKTIIKFGGGFYCGYFKSDDMYVINGFYMGMRGKFTTPGESIHYYTVEFMAGALSWEKFRAEVLGATDPNEAPAGALRNVILKQWKALGLKSQPNTGDNGLHASASPYEALAERMNWLGVNPSRDTYGKAMLANGITVRTIKEWSSDPAVKGASLFDQLEDMTSADCLKKSVELSRKERKPREPREKKEKKEEEKKEEEKKEE